VDAQNAAFGAASIVMGTAYHSVQIGGSARVLAPSLHDAL
jgi:hypothetical protein